MEGEEDTRKRLRLFSISPFFFFFKPGICSGVGWAHSELQKLSLGIQRDHGEPPLNS